MKLLQKLFKKEQKPSNEVLHIVSESAYTEVYLKNKGWHKLLSQGEYGEHEGLKGLYYNVCGFGKVHKKYCEHFR